MSNFGAAAAASARVPIAVMAREPLHTGAIVQIKIPPAASHGSYPCEGRQVPYIQFARNIRGGRLNFFVHTDDVSLCGETIVASASVLKKVLEDGREYLYVDLHPLATDTPVTHQLAIMSAGPGSWDSDDHLVFATPKPLEGLIVLGPPGAKMVPASLAQKRVPPRAVPAAALRNAPTTGDAQLDRLLRDGWEIESSDSKCVRLFRKRGVEFKTMTHYRPKTRRT